MPLQNKQFLAANNSTITANGTLLSSFPTVGVNQVAEYEAIVQVANAPTGTSPTLIIKFQVSVDGINFVDVAGAATASITAAGTYRIAAFETLAPYVQIVDVVGGTTPSFTGVTCTVIYANKTGIVM